VEGIYRLLTGTMKNSVEWILAEASKREQGNIIPGRSVIIAWLRGQNLRHVSAPNFCPHCLDLRKFVKGFVIFNLDQFSLF